MGLGLPFNAADCHHGITQDFQHRLLGTIDSTPSAFVRAALLHPANQPAVEGRQAIQASYEAMFKAGKIKIAFTPLETQVVGDWAYDRGNYTFMVTPKSGKSMEASSKYLVICKRLSDGSWKLYREMSNTNTPPPTAAGKKK